MNGSEWSKIGLAFAVGVSLSAGYVAVGMNDRIAEPELVVVQERCPEPLAPEARPEPASAQPESEDMPCYGFSEFALKAMARNCDVRDDSPAALDDELVAQLGLSAAEREAWAAALEHVEADERAVMASLFAELGHEPEPGLTGMETHEQLHAAVATTRRPGDAELRRHLAEERAGLRAPPTPEELAAASAWARWERFRLTNGDRFAAAMTKHISEERVDELRKRFNGWPPGGRTRHFRCAGSPEAYVSNSGFRVEGGLDAEVVRRIFDAHLRELVVCTSGAVERGTRKGKATLALVINDEGRVSRSTVRESTYDDALIDSCLVNASSKWRFPKPSSDSVRVEFPLNFYSP